MFAFEVKNMTCGQCVRTITTAVMAVDRDAKVEADLGQQLVMIAPAAANARELLEAIAMAGYKASQVDSAPIIRAGTNPTRGGCCGSCH